MRELGYHPNLNARNLANKHSKALGVVLPNATHAVFQNPFFPEVLRGISTVAHEKGYVLYLSTGQTKDQILDDVIQMVQGKRVDGVILLHSLVEEGGQNGVAALMSLSLAPTAIVVADDLMTLGVYQMLNNLGVSVPNDVSIISFNNLIVSEVSVPPMTTVEINIFKLGCEATKLIIEQVKHPKLNKMNIVLPHQLIERESCKRVPE